jgi:hypothetical protein
MNRTQNKTYRKHGCTSIMQWPVNLSIAGVLPERGNVRCSQTKRQLSFLAMLLLLPFTTTCSAQVADSAEVVNSLTKCWHAFSHEYSNIYGLEEEEIKEYSKQRVCFTRDSIITYHGIVYTPKYSIKKVNTASYAKANFDCTKQKLGILKDSVYEVTISSFSKSKKDGSLHKMTDIIVYEGACIYVVVDGVIFKLLDADAIVRPSSSQ